MSDSNEMSTNKTRANHAIVFNGTLHSSDDILEAIQEHEEAELVYQRHSTGRLFVEPESESK
jgi:hypothetical protein